MDLLMLCARKLWLAYERRRSSLIPINMPEPAHLQIRTLWWLLLCRLYHLRTVILQHSVDGMPARPAFYDEYALTVANYLQSDEIRTDEVFWHTGDPACGLPPSAPLFGWNSSVQPPDG